MRLQLELLKIFETLSFLTPVDVHQDSLYVVSQCSQVLRGHQLAGLDFVYLLNRNDGFLFMKIVDSHVQHRECLLPFEKSFYLVEVVVGAGSINGYALRE